MSNNGTITRGSIKHICTSTAVLWCTGIFLFLHLCDTIINL